ncbi:hypothetical protein BGZ59_003958, partial [Podila verticillata]
FQPSSLKLKRRSTFGDALEPEQERLSMPTKSHQLWFVDRNLVTSFFKDELLSLLLLEQKVILDLETGQEGKHSPRRRQF